LFPRLPKSGAEQTTSSTQSMRFPWHVAVRKRNGRPLIVDADNVVVAQMMSGTFADAERIVANCNRHFVQQCL
jgi:hypothetical protein